MKTLRFYSGTSPGSVFSTGRKILSFFLPFFLLSMHLSVSTQYRCEDIGSPESLSECNPAASGSSLSAFLVDTTIYGTGDTCMIDEFDEPIFNILSQDCNEVCVQVNYPAEFVAHGTPVILYWENSQFLGDTVYGDSILHYLQSDTLRSGDDSDLLTIADYCYSDGGAPVYDARALAWVLLDDVIYEAHCVQASPLPDSPANVTTKMHTLSLAPNPTGGQVQVYWGSGMNGPVRIEMISINGQLIRSIELTHEEEFYIMNLAGVPPGTYMVRVNDGKQIQVGKLIIN